MSWLLHRYLYEWQSATQYSDPNNICSAGATGYRAVSDCTGYAYCNNGYLMGGGSEYELVNSVMPCPNAQLFDNSIQACSSTMTKCPTGGGVVVEKPKTRSPSNRPTNKPIQTSTTSRPPPPAPRQPVPQSTNPTPNNIDDDGEDWSSIPLQSNNTPPRSTPSPVRPPNEQAANAIVESATSNTVDNEGEEDWSSTPLDVNIPSPTPPPLEWIGYIPENENDNTPSSSISQSTSSSSTTQPENDEKRCTTNKDCYNLTSNQQFCNQPTPYDIGYCGQCMIFNGMGCATNELCLIDQEGEGRNICHELQGGISNSQSIGITKCYKYLELDIDCQIMLNDSKARCNVEKMICEGSKQQQEAVDSSGIEQGEQGNTSTEEGDRINTRCNLCGETNFNTINANSIVYFTGEEVTCNQLKDRISNMERISTDDCGVIQRSYSSTCCIQQNDNNIYGIPPSPVRDPSIDTTVTTTNAPSAYHYLNNWKTVQNGASASYYESMSTISTLVLFFACLW